MSIPPPSKPNGFQTAQPSKPSCFQKAPSVQPKIYQPPQKTQYPPPKNNFFQGARNSKKITGKAGQTSLTNFFAPKDSPSKKFPLRDSSNVHHAEQAQLLAVNKPVVASFGSVPKPVASVSPMQAQRKSSKWVAQFEYLLMMLLFLFLNLTGCKFIKFWNFCTAIFCSFLVRLKLICDFVLCSKMSEFEAFCSVLNFLFAPCLREQLNVPKLEISEN